MKKHTSAGHRTAWFFAYLFMILCVAVAVFPIIWVILSSFKTNQEILSNGLSLPGQPHICVIIVFFHVSGFYMKRQILSGRTVFQPGRNSVFGYVFQ